MASLKQIALRVCENHGITLKQLQTKNIRSSYNHERQNDEQRVSILKAKKEFILVALESFPKIQVSTFLGYSKGRSNSLKNLLNQSLVISWYANNGGRYSKDHVTDNRNAKFLNDSSVCEYVFGNTE